MESVLWYVLAGTRGGTNRARILRALDDRPRNANQLAEDLDLDYKTVRHHLDVLMDNDVWFVVNPACPSATEATTTTSDDNRDDDSGSDDGGGDDGGGSGGPDY